jgi:hypothetical protein
VSNCPISLSKPSPARHAMTLGRLRLLVWYIS